MGPAIKYILCRLGRKINEVFTYHQAMKQRDREDFLDAMEKKNC